MTWTHFWDMHSGGQTKVVVDGVGKNHIYVELPQPEAEVFFQNRFGRNPHRVTCTCCGEDYSVDSHESLSQITGFHRNLRCLETPRLENGRYDNNDPIIKSHLYLEDGEEPPPGYAVSARYRSARVGVPLDEYLKADDVIVIYAKDIEVRRGGGGR